MLTCIDYMGVRNDASAHDVFTNVVNAVPRTSVDKLVHSNWLNENGRRRMLQPEQKSVILMKYLVQKFSKPGHIAVGRLCEDFFYSKSVAIAGQKYNICRM